MNWIKHEGLPLNRNVEQCLGAGKAALKPLSFSFSREVNPRPENNRGMCPRTGKTKLDRDSVLECASPLALSTTHDFQSARGLAHSKTLRRYERFMEMFPCAFILV